MGLAKSEVGYISNYDLGPNNADKDGKLLRCLQDI